MDIRPVEPDEFEAFSTTIAAAFLGDYEAEEFARERTVFEFDRSLGAFEDGVPVATFGAYTMSLSVPGGEVPTAGTTWVSVASTHRRRGLLRRMMQQHLEDVARRGEALAVLWASEAQLYRRYGYGLGSEEVTIEVRTRPAPELAPHAGVAGGTIRHVPAAEAAATLAPVYAAVRARRPGMVARSEAWWHFQVLADAKDRGGFSTKRVAALMPDGGTEAAAYAVYQAKEEWRPGGEPGGALQVTELAGVDGPSEAALWRFLLATDLVVTVQARHRPVDDPLPLLLADLRQVRRRKGDALWVRVVDPPAALTGRTWAAPLDLVLEVEDQLLPANAGRWRLRADDAGAATCDRSDREPDLACPIEALGALYLGGTPATQLAAAGLLRERTPGAVIGLDRAARSPLAPWAPEVF